MNTNLQQVNAVILNELFPRCRRDSRHAVHFDQWEFSGFVPDPSSTINLIGKISARYKREGTIHSIRAMIDVDVLAQTPVKMFGHIDAHLVGKINLLTNGVMESEKPVSGCCGAPIDFMASIPLCVRCNGELLNDGRVYSERHRIGHNERCGLQSGLRKIGSATEIAIFDPKVIDSIVEGLHEPGEVITERPQVQTGGGFVLNKRFDRGRTFAVIYKHPTYGEPDYRALAREMVMNAALDASWPIEQMKSQNIELVFHCHIVLMDDSSLDEHSRGYRFDSVYVMPPATMISEGVRRALAPQNEY